MKDKIHRIKILWRLFKIWNSNPYLRLGQLIENVFPCNPPKGIDTCIYYSKDETLIYAIERFYKEVNKNDKS